MTDDHRDDDRDNRDEPSDDHWLSTLLSALVSLESGDGRERRTGRHRGDRSVIDYDVSIRSGDDLLDGGSADESGDSRRERTPFTRDDDSDRTPGRRDDRDHDRDRRTRRYRASGPSSDHRVTTRSYEDELLVTADVGGIDPDDVTVGFDDSTLVIAVSGSELDRVDVPWEHTQSRATIKNGVLTVQIEPESSGSESPSASEPEDDDE